MQSIGKSLYKASCTALTTAASSSPARFGSSWRTFANVARRSPRLAVD